MSEKTTTVDQRPIPLAPARVVIGTATASDGSTYVLFEMPIEGKGTLAVLFEPRHALHIGHMMAEKAAELVALSMARQIIAPPAPAEPPLKN